MAAPAALAGRQEGAAGDRDGAASQRPGDSQAGVLVRCGLSVCVCERESV